MGHSNRVNAFWTSTALAVLVSCSINPQPEPPGLDVPTGNAAKGGATAVVVVAAGGNYSIGVGVGGMQSAGVGGAAYDMSTGGATNDTASYDGGLRGDAGYASGLDAAVDATPDVSSGRSSPTDSQGN